nr:alpha/beta hydrolase [Terriglobus roseus]
MIPGLGGTAHVFDTIAPRMAERYHVLGITPRGTGSSSSPVPDGTNYSASQLGTDLVAVLDALKLVNPVLIGHSFAGEELSFVGSRAPDRVAGLVYLDAAYGYAFYDPSKGNLLIDSRIVREELAQLVPGKGPANASAIIRSLLEELPRLQGDLMERQNELRDYPPPPDADKEPVPSSFSAMMAGQEKFTNVGVPLLAVFALRHRGPAREPHPNVEARADASDVARTRRYIATLRKDVPTARVVILPHATHSVFVSNQDDVLNEIHKFIDSLPR